MSSSRRALYQAAGGVRKRASKLRRAGELSLTSSPLDFAGRLHASQRVLRSHVDRRDALVDIIRAVHATLEPAEIADVIVERASAWVPASCWAVVSADLSAQLSVLSGRGVTPENNAAVYAVAKWVMHRGEEFSTDDLRGDARVRGDSIGAVLALPLLGRDRRVGALIGFDRAAATQKPRLAPSLLRAVNLLLEPAAMALDSALLLKRAEELSVTDDLTQLYNSRYMNLVLRRETKRASRSGRPLSLLFIDLDGIKAVNDTHGHLMGSKLLAEVGQMLRNNCRLIDFAFRYGGDEFVILLPQTSKENACVVARRLHKLIRESDWLTAEGLKVRITTSAGVASFPNDSRTKAQLLHLADEAMYLVKNSTRDSVAAAHQGLLPAL